MKNPWIKKNPLLSMWLSGANAVAGKVRGRATAESKRRAASMTNAAIRQASDFWSAALGTPPAPKRKKKPRK